ncbi:MAG: hypothetical protein EXX96DRAFT_583162 [Benjaminiella poitrasii]|nr:MAG: hypothetical protein EXX96DRAFT_583162 [Benjaminiella poitrasii]
MISKTTTSSVSKAILLLSLVVLPCSCAYITATSHGRKTSLYDMILSPLVLKSVLVWIVFEIMFYLYFLRTKKRLQQTTKPKKSLNKSERTNLFWNCVHTIPDLTSWSEGWFYYKKDYSHPSFKDIHRENLALW